MAADIFGQAVHHDVGAVFDGFAQDRSGDRVVDDERHAAGVGHLARAAMSTMLPAGLPMLSQ